MIKFLLKWLAIILIGLPLSLYIVLALINLTGDEEKSSLVLEFEKHIAKKSDLNNTENAYIYMMGITAKPSDNFYERGVERVQKRLSILNQSPHNDEPTFTDYIEISSFESRLETLLTDTKCNLDQPLNTQCQTHLIESEKEITDLLSDAELLLHRYNLIKQKTDWYEILPEYSRFVTGLTYKNFSTLHRLSMLSIWQHSRNNDADIELLIEKEGKFLRNFSKSSNLLISKVIATELIEEFFNWSHLLLSIDNGKPLDVAQIKSLYLPFADEESGFNEVMIGEWHFIKGFYKQIEHDEIPLQYRWLRPLIQFQATINLHAKYNKIIFSFKSETTKKDIIDDCIDNNLINLIQLTYNPIGKLFSCTNLISADIYRKGAEEIEIKRSQLIEAIGHPIKSPLNNKDSSLK